MVSTAKDILSYEISSLERGDIQVSLWEMLLSHLMSAVKMKRTNKPKSTLSAISKQYANKAILLAEMVVASGMDASEVLPTKARNMKELFDIVEKIIKDNKTVICMKVDTSSEDKKANSSSEMADAYESIANAKRVIARCMKELAE